MLEFNETVPDKIVLQTGEEFLTLADDVRIADYDKNPDIASVYDFSENASIIDPALRDNILFWGSGYGEFLISKMVIQHLEEANIRFNWWFTSYSRYFDKVLEEKIPTQRIIKLEHSPYFVMKLLTSIRPTLICTVENSGPEMMEMVRLAAGWAKIPVVMLSAKVANSYMRDTLKAGRSLKYYEIAKAFKAVSYAVTEDSKNAQALLDFHVERDRIMLGNSVKWCCSRAEDRAGLKRSVRQKWELDDDGIIWVAGSVHHKEEMRIILDTYYTLKKNHNIKLIFAPRHFLQNPNGYIEIFSKYKSCLWSECGEKLNGDVDIILVDTFGDLNTIYEVGDIAFVGGGFEPGWAGHNVTEPLNYGLPVVIGPSYENFRNIVDLFREGKGIVVANDEQELYDVMDYLVKSPGEVKEQIQNARKILESFTNKEPMEVTLLKRILTEKNEQS